MIRKPDAGDFRESGAVSALRDAGTLAVEGAKGVRDGTAMFVGRASMVVMAFGFVLSMAMHIGPVLLLVVLAGGGAWFFGRCRTRTGDLDALRHPQPIRPGRVAAAIAPEVHALSVGPVGRHAATIAVPAMLIFPTSNIATVMSPFALAGIVYLALAMLLVARLFGDRTVVRYDAQALTVVGLLGEATILWADVADVVVRKVSMVNLRVLFTSGARKNLVVVGRINRLGGPDTLYIPVDLLDLDRDGLHALVTRMLVCSAGAGDVVPPAAARIEPVHPVPAPYVEPAPAAVPFATPAAADMPFDPDAIMARYMAERDRIRAEQRPDLAVPRRATFGRKGVGAR